jgi:CheY-like chemotaxis protein
LPVILLSAPQNNRVQMSARLSDTTIVWKPLKQAALHQALRSINPVTIAMPPARPRLLPAVQAGDLASDLVGDLAGDRVGDLANRRLTILIAEDNAINQRVALRLLELLGYRADVASSGQEVLTALKHQCYDVILMDMRMPELDGIDTTRQIRQMPLHANTWIIAMTANAMARDRQRCFEAGMDDYLSKPINRAALGQALQRVPARHESDWHS